MLERLPSQPPTLPPFPPSGGHHAPSGYPAPADAPPADLRERLDVLRRHVWLVLLVTVVALGVAVQSVRTHQPQYRASAVLRLVDARKAITGGLEGAVAEEALGRGVDPLLSQIQVLRSRSVAGRVVDSLGLRLVARSADFPRSLLRGVRVGPEVAADTLRLRFGADGYEVRASGVPAARAGYGRPVEVGGVAFAVAGAPEMDQAELVVVSRAAAVNALQDALVARGRDRTDVVDVSYVAHDPRLAQQVVNAVATAFQTENARSAQQQSRRRRLFVEERLRTTHADLLAAQQALTDFRRREQVYSSQERLAGQQAGLMELETRRGQMSADRWMYQSMLQELRRGGPEADRDRLRTLVVAPGIADNPVVAQLYQRLAQYEASRDSLTSGSWASAPTNPDVRKLDELAAATEARLTGAVENHIAALDAQIAALDDLRARNAAALRSMPSTEAEEARLLQEVEGARAMVEQLRAEYQKAQIAEAVEAGQVEIVDLATLPDQPIGAGNSRKLAFGLLAGLLLGGGGAFLLERLNTSIRRKDELEGVLHVPSLAIIPRIAAQRRLGLAVPLPRAVRGGRGDGGGGDHELVTLEALGSTGSDAYRTLRTNLIFSQAVQSLRVLTVTSAGPHEGKTTTAANLAVTFAQQGMRVLLVDCDLRRARLHQLFGVERSPGITQLLTGEHRPAEAVRPTGVEGLWVLPSGTLPPNPVELLGGERMRRVLGVLAEQYEMVILDSPPLLVAADAAVLGTRSDGVLLVVRAGQTERVAAQQAVEQLHAVGARVVGAVLNDPDAKVAGYAGYYHYDYEYAEARG